LPRRVEGSPALYFKSIRFKAIHFKTIHFKTRCKNCGAAIMVSTLRTDRLRDIIAENGEGPKMRRWLGFSMVVAASLALLCNTADAGHRRHHHHHHKTDPRLTIVGIGVGAGMTAAYFGLRGWNHSSNAKVSSGGAFALTTVGCAALSPIVGTMVLNRPLTMREAHVMIADCVVPFLGGWAVNAAFDDHPEWEGKKRRR
jgi:hypothetical protein